MHALLVCVRSTQLLTQALCCLRLRAPNRDEGNDRLYKDTAHISILLLGQEVGGVNCFLTREYS